MTDFDKDRTVKADMERVFRPLSGRPHAPEHLAAIDRDLQTRRSSAGERGGFRWLTFAAPVLLVLFVAAFAIRLGITEPATSRTVRGPSPEPLAQAVAPRNATAAAPAAGPSPVPVAGEVARADRIRHSTAGTSEPPPREAGAAPRAGGPTVATLAVKARRMDGPAARVAAPAVVASTASEARGLRTSRLRGPSDEPCAPGSEEDRCIYQDVVQADARLRGAYKRAMRNGVPTSELAGITRRWARAQRVSLEEPDQAIRRYDRLADELNYLSNAE